MLYILILIVCGIAQFFLPWWAIAPICFILAFWQAKSGLQAFASATLAITSLWSGYATYIHIASAGILTAPMAKLLPLGGNISAIIFVTGFIGGLVAGFSALSGYWLKENIQ